MAIKIQGQTIIDNSQNINVTGTVTATEFKLPDGSPISGSASITVSAMAPATSSLEEGALWWNSSADDTTLYVLYSDPDTAAKQWVQASPSTSAIDLSNYDTSAEVDTKIANINIPSIDLSNYDTSAEVDTKLSNVKVSSLFGDTNDNMFVTAKDTSSKILDIGNGMIELNADLGSISIGNITGAPLSTTNPWETGIYIDSTDANNDDGSLISVCGIGTSDSSAAFKAIDGKTGREMCNIGHNGSLVLRKGNESEIQVGTAYTAGLGLYTIPEGVLQLYNDGSSTNSAIEIIDGNNSPSKRVVQIYHNGNAHFNANTTDWNDGVYISGNDTNGSRVSVYTDGSKNHSAFQIYDGTNDKQVFNVFHDGGANFYVNSTDWNEGVRISGNDDDDGSRVSIYTNGSHTASALHVYNGSSSSNVFSVMHNGDVSTATKVTSSEDSYFNACRIGKGSGNIVSNLTLGSSSLSSNSTGEYCTAIGHYSLSKNVGGEYNTALGYTSLYENVGGSYNTSIGGFALRENESGTRNTATGAYALNKTVDGSYNNAYGVSALYNNTAGSYNIAIGQQSLETNTTGDYNVAVGSYALQNAAADGDYITAVGSFALRNVNYAGGADITAIGYNAGSAAGNFANQSTYVGAWSGNIEDGANRSNITCLGYGANCNNNDQVQLGNSATTAFAYAWQTRSDERDKTDIRDTLLGLDFIKSLRPVDFRWDYREDYIDRDPETHETTSVLKDGSRKRVRFHHGLIAQEVKEAADAQGVDFAGYQDPKITGGDDKLSLGYNELIAPLIKAVQELSAENEALKARLDAAGL
tara:strand:+ start:1902 stop:4331 length:2430 start_codon:yes stop_codon:yes gene_type:complete